MSKLMIVAHPDDEIVFGGQEMLGDSNWKVLCLTNGYDSVRSREFENSCEKLGVQYEIAPYKDRWEGFTDSELLYIECFIHHFLCDEPRYEYIVTHNSDGEYGHIQHKQIHKIVARLAKKHDYELRVFSLSDSIDRWVADAKIDVLSEYATRHLGMFDLLPFILRGDTKLFKFEGEYSKLTREDLSEAFDNVIDSMCQEECERSGFGLCSKEDWIDEIGPLADEGLVIGYRSENYHIEGFCYLRKSTLDSRSYTTSVAVSESVRGKGVGSNLKNRAIEYAFDILDAKSIFDIIDVENIPSIKASLNCCMTIVGVSDLRMDGRTKVLLRKDNPRWR